MRHSWLNFVEYADQYQAAGPRETALIASTDDAEADEGLPEWSHDGEDPFDPSHYWRIFSGTD